MFTLYFSSWLQTLLLFQLMKLSGQDNAQAVSLDHCGIEKVRVLKLCSNVLWVLGSLSGGPPPLIRRNTFYPQYSICYSTFILIIATESVVVPEGVQTTEAEGVNSQPGSLWDREGIKESTARN